MDDSILTSIKKIIGIGDDETQNAFDESIIMYINSAIQVLRQIGIGPPSGFIVYDNSSLWIEYIGDESILAMVKSYIAQYVRKEFDPPANSTAMQSLEKSLNELLWRLNIEYENNKGGI